MPATGFGIQTAFGQSQRQPGWQEEERHGDDTVSLLRAVTGGITGTAHHRKRNG